MSLIGRDRDRTHIMTLLVDPDADTKQQRVVLVEGPSQRGKTALLTDINGTLPGYVGPLQPARPCVCLFPS